MAILHVGAGGSNTSPYETWAKAASSIVTVGALAAAGDTIYFESTYTDSAAGQNVLFPNSTAASPIYILSGTHTGASGLDALAAGGVVKSTNTTFVYGQDTYTYGLTFEASSASNTDMIFNRSSGTRVTTFDNCTFYISSATPTASKVSYGYDSSGTAQMPLTVLKNPVFRLGNSSQTISLNSYVQIYGGSHHASSTDPSPYFTVGSMNRGAVVTISGFDFTNLGGSVVLFNINNGQAIVTARDCKVPASWSGGLTSGLTTGGNRADLYNYGVSGVTGSNFKFWSQTPIGSVREDSTIYLTGSGSDGVTPYSQKIASGSSASFVNPLRSLPMEARVDATTGGAPSAVSVEITFDDATAHTDKNVWLEVELLGTTDYPISTFSNDSCPVLTGSVGSGTTQTSSGSSWTGTSGFTNGKTQTLSVTGLDFKHRGYVRATVCVGIASKTVYVDPKLTIT